MLQVVIHHYHSVMNVGQTGNFEEGKAVKLIKFDQLSHYHAAEAISEGFATSHQRKSPKAMFVSDQ